MTDITIVIATKNGAKLLSRAVESIQKQTLQYWELVIVSDGSTDNTAEIARQLASSDPRITVIELEENVGPGAARNIAIEKAKGKYIAFLDDDDSWLSAEKLVRQKDYLDAHPNTVVVGASRVEFIRETNSGSSHHMFWLSQEVDAQKIHANMLSYNPIVTSSAMIRKDVFEKAGRFRPMYLAEEFDLWFRMGRLGEIANIEGADTRYSVRDSSISRVRNMEMALTVLKLGKEYKAYYPHYIKAFIKGYARIVLVFLKNILK
jgi:glycosyltransferase involved in cell wall biosynthesis